MTDQKGNTRCPHCGIDTGIPRGAPADLPVRLTLSEFETLVRNDWRRRMGPESYGRSHPEELIRSLMAVLAEKGGEISPAQIEVGMMQVLADLRAAGKGRQALLHEIAKLRHAVRTVLRKAGADFVTAGDYVSRARLLLDESLDSLASR